jgi:hypothetical protein
MARQWMTRQEFERVVRAEFPQIAQAAIDAATAEDMYIRYVDSLDELRKGGLQGLLDALEEAFEEAIECGF